jgi:hypothetical protein
MENIKETIRNIIKEESEYQQFFRKALEKAGKSIPDMSDEEKKAFFNKIDTAWDGKGEKNEGNAFGAAVTKAKEEGDDEFSVGGKTYPVKESVNDIKPGDVVSVTRKDGKLYKDKVEKTNPLKIRTSPSDTVVIGNNMIKSVIKESVNEYDEWKNTRIQSKNIFRMLKQKYNNNISKMKDGLELILKQNKTKNDQAEVIRDEFNKFFKIKTETVNENFSNDDIAKIKGAVESASSFMGIGSELKKLGMKYDFSTSPLPVYMIKKGSKTFVLVNKKYADKPDFIVNDTAGGLLESKSVNETKFKSGDKVLISHPTMIKPFKGIVSTTLNAKGEEVLVLKGDKGIWDAKFAKLDEGNAFGAAVTAAKKEGKKEFEFNGKIYKVKKGSYEKNEAAKKLTEKKK